VKRVAVIGSGGAGKSMFALELAKRLGLPVIHLDREYWRPGWEPTPEPEWEARVAEIVKSERWIIDGNFGGTMHLRLAAADTIVFLDIPRLVCAWAVITRWLRYRRRSRPDMAPRLNDKLDLKFLRWIWGYPNTRRPGILRQLAELPPSTHVVRLTSRRQMRDWLDSVASSSLQGVAA
jgi:adenylate kinase family enzyme